MGVIHISKMEHWIALDSLHSTHSTHRKRRRTGKKALSKELNLRLRPRYTPTKFTVRHGTYESGFSCPRQSRRNISALGRAPYLVVAQPLLSVHRPSIALVAFRRDRPPQPSPWAIFCTNVHNTERRRSRPWSRRHSLGHPNSGFYSESGRAMVSRTCA